MTSSLLTIALPVFLLLSGAWLVNTAVNLGRDTGRHLRYSLMGAVGVLFWLNGTWLTVTLVAIWLTGN